MFSEGIFCPYGTINTLINGPYGPMDAKVKYIKYIGPWIIIITCYSFLEMGSFKHRAETMWNRIIHGSLGPGGAKTLLWTRKMSLVAVEAKRHDSEAKRNDCEATSDDFEANKL